MSLQQPHLPNKAKTTPHRRPTVTTASRKDPKWEDMDMDPGPSFPSQTEEEMEAREDSWAETVNQFVREQAQKNKPKKAQDQHRAMTVRPNKRKNIRQTCSIPISDTSTLATDPPEKSSPQSVQPVSGPRVEGDLQAGDKRPHSPQRRQSQSL